MAEAIYRMSRRNHFHTHQKKQYRSRRFHNPYFQKTTDVPWMLIGIILTSIVLIFVATFYLLRHKQFALHTITVSGNQYISDEALQKTISEYLLKRRFYFFQEANRFLFEREKLEKYLHTVFVVEHAEVIEENLSLFITLQERTSQLIWKTNAELFLVDMQGIVIRKIEVGEYEQNALIQALPFFVDKNNVEIAVSDAVMTAREVESIFLFQKRLSEQLSIKSRKIEMDRLAGKWTGIETDQGYQILFDPSGDIEGQIQRLQALFNQTSFHPDKLEYVDLRFGDHVYYK